MQICYMTFDESLFFLACLNFAIFTANFIIPLRSHLSFDKSEVNSSIYGLCGVELMPFQCLRPRRRSKPTNFQNYSSASGDIWNKEKKNNKIKQVLALVTLD